MLDATALIDLVNLKTGEPTDNSGRWTDAQVLTYLNLSQDEIALAIPGLLRTNSSSLTSVSGTSSYTIPATVGKVFNVLYGGVAIQPKSRDSLQQEVVGADTDEKWTTITGTPKYWYVEANSIYLYPAPDAASTVITLNGELVLTELTDSASSYPFENYACLRKAQKILVLLASAECMLDDGDIEMHDNMTAEARGLISELERDWLERKTTDTHSIITERMSEVGEATNESPTNYY